MTEKKILERDIERGLDLIEADKNKELVKYMFLDFHNQPSLLKKLNPKRYKKYKEILKKLKGKRKEINFRGSGNSNKISEAFQLWEYCGFLIWREEKEEEKEKEILTTIIL